MTFQCNNKIAQRTARAFCAVPPATSHVRSAHIAAAVGATFTTLRPFIPVPLAACGKARLECRLTKETAYAPARVLHAGSHRAPGGVWPTLCFSYSQGVVFEKFGAAVKPPPAPKTATEADAEEAGRLRSNLATELLYQPPQNGWCSINFRSTLYGYMGGSEPTLPPTQAGSATMRAPELLRPPGASCVICNRRTLSPRLGYIHRERMSALQVDAPESVRT